MDDPVQCNREKCDDIEKKRITWAKKEEEMTECVVMTSKEKEEQVRTALMRREGKGNKLSREKRKEISTRGKNWKMWRTKTKKAAVACSNKPPRSPFPT